MVLPASILLPLYIYPSPGAWDPAFTAVAGNPNVLFNIVQNPDSGPSTTTCPPDDFIAGIAKLRTYSNVRMLGYVHTTYATRAYSDVSADVDAYLSWSKCTKGDTHMDGIFFDEAPAAYSTADYAYIKNITDHVRATFPASQRYTQLNPGYITDASYYNIADNIVAFENDYTYFSDSDFSTVTAAQLAKSSALILGFNGTADQQYTVLKDIQKLGFSQSLISEREDYNQFPALFPQFVAQAAGKYKVSSTSSGARTTSTAITSTKTSTRTSTTSAKATSTKRRHHW